VPQTILIMAGGTGGHIFPGLAVAEVLAARGWRVVWMGARDAMEAQLVPGNGYEMAWVNFHGVRGKGLPAFLLLPIRLLRACWQAASAMRRISPDVVLGMGGYISFPGAMMALALGRTLVIHEQNAVAGTTSRLLARLAHRVLTSFTSAFPPAIGAILTGNPIRAQLTQVPSPQQRFADRQGPIQITVLGGSLGANALNEVIPQALAALPQAARPRVVHQAGRQHAAALEARYRSLSVEARVTPFVDDMAQQLSWSDLVICRAGATTLAELAAVGVAAILVPYPHAIDDHQTRNAQALVEAGAAIMVLQSDLNAERIVNIVRGLDRPSLLAMANAARAQARPNAATRVADICEQVAHATGRRGR
jgi:UDP-N-acetylglucosamine--N-acetylmuramyl-(pentapeptide) pyrophosphoryl-undecaprenol N-acetylglucosamine transferase